MGVREQCISTTISRMFFVLPRLFAAQLEVVCMWGGGWPVLVGLRRRYVPLHGGQHC